MRARGRNESIVKSLTDRMILSMGAAYPNREMLAESGAKKYPKRTAMIRTW
jgi:hypothetical protein